MYQPEDLTRLFGDQRMHRLICIKESSPGHVGDVVGQSCQAFAPIERVIAIPKNLPLMEIGWQNRANHDFVGQIRSLLEELLSCRAYKIRRLSQTQEWQILRLRWAPRTRPTALSMTVIFELSSPVTSLTDFDDVRSSGSNIFG